MIKDATVRAVLTAFAVGDAAGMPTEFMTRSAIKSSFTPFIRGIIAPSRSQNHANLPYASVTDDTEQNLYLFRLYRREGRVDAEATAECLLAWVKETGAIEKQYIGPSSLAALTAIQSGTPVSEAGLHGTTCGGVMRTPAAVLYREHADEDDLAEDIQRCLLCTHNTSQALEAAGAYGFALRAALRGTTRREILAAAVRGGRKLLALAPQIDCAPSSTARIREFYARAARHTPTRLLDDLYAVYGTGLASADVCAAAFGIFFSAKNDVWKAIRMGASVGGDTDTIAALAGALCCAYAGGHNIPADVITHVFRNNAVLHGPPWEECP